MDDDRIGAHAGSVANRDIAHDLGAGSDENIAADYRILSALGADSYLVFDVNIRSAANPAIDDHAGRMNEHETGAKISATADDAIAEHGVDLVEQHLQRL